MPNLVTARANRKLVRNVRHTIGSTTHSAQVDAVRHSIECERAWLWRTALVESHRTACQLHEGD